MASSKGKARDRPERRRIVERILRSGVRSRVKSTRHKRANTPYRRQPYDSVSIPQLVYELLTIDKYNQDARRRRSSEGIRTTGHRMRNCHEPRGLPYETVDRCDSPESIQVPEYAMESRATSVESLTEVMDAANSSAPTSSANSSVTNVSMEPITLANSLNNARALLKKRSLVQLINSYIKAGIEEGKRQAKKYIRKALSFGVKSGYLIPTDERGNMLRVCPTLAGVRRADAESRRKRRIARRGEARVTTIDDRKAMRRGIPRGKPRRDVTAETTTSKRKYKKDLTESPTGGRGARGNSPRKSLDGTTPRRERNKPKTSAVRRKRSDDKSNNRWDQRRGKHGDSENVKKPIKRRRTALSPKRIEDNHEPIEKSHKSANDRDCDRCNEDNYRTVTERRKSTSSQENGLGMEKQRAGRIVDDDRNVERRHDKRDDNDGDDDDDEDEKSEGASVERDANGTIDEMNA